LYVGVCDAGELEGMSVIASSSFAWESYGDMMWPLVGAEFLQLMDPVVLEPEEEGGF
jgi:hypothetical protein